MQVPKTILNPISFKYRSILKTEWLRGNLPTVTKGIYGGDLTPETVSLEHIKCRCYNGKTELNNLALATKELNGLRGNKPLRFFLDAEKFIEYIMGVSYSTYHYLFYEEICIIK